MAMFSIIWGLNLKNCPFPADISLLQAAKLLQSADGQPVDYIGVVGRTIDEGTDLTAANLYGYFEAARNTEIYNCFNQQRKAVLDCAGISDEFKSWLRPQFAEVFISWRTNTAKTISDLKEQVKQLKRDVSRAESNANFWRNYDSDE